MEVLSESRALVEFFRSVQTEQLRLPLGQTLSFIPRVGMASIYPPAYHEKA